MDAAGEVLGVDVGSKKVFHSVENFFPHCGKFVETLSTLWKNRESHGNRT